MGTLIGLVLLFGIVYLAMSGLKKKVDARENRIKQAENLKAEYIRKLAEEDLQRLEDEEEDEDEEC